MEPPIPPDDPAAPEPPASPDASHPPTVFGPYAFDESRRLVLRDGRKIALTAKEFALALTLFRQMGENLGRADLLTSIWGRDPNLATRTLDAHVSRIRTKLELYPENGLRLATIYAYGYRLERTDEA